MTPIQASKKLNEKVVHSTLKDNRGVQKPKFNLGHLVRTADIKRVFTKGGSTTVVINYTQKQKSYTTQFPHIELSFCLKEIRKTYYYQQN